MSDDKIKLDKNNFRLMYNENCYERASWGQELLSEEEYYREWIKIKDDKNAGSTDQSM